ncbi:hypothetical protein [Streptomyces sp. Y7]|uniref:hypothetical protein n=1 Tax=Streptomyces sp. Y7 TaxID=3342392 RepID=UPI00371B9839
MTARTVSTETVNVLHVAETGWSKARHLSGRRVRTCVAPVADPGATPSPPAGAERNIVRGED